MLSWYSGASRRYHLRTLADYAVTVCRDRGLLTEGSARGRWRLVRDARIAPHPHGRIFTASVGVAEAAVPDTWAASAQSHLWLSQRSLQLSRGDHVFALGAGRQSAVLGLFEVTSSGVSRTPRSPSDPDRWRWAVAVQPLASVPPAVAVSVPGVTAPRGTAQLVGDPRRQADLYAAVESNALGAAAGHVTEASQTERLAIARRPRRFDPERRPNPSQSDTSMVDVEESLALQEKARQGHHALLVNLHAALARAGWTDLEEIPAAIDLRGRTPSGQRIIFEAKTVSASNETSQCRSAVAQLLEYRLEYGQPEDALCLAVDERLSERRAEILDRLGIAVVMVGADDASALNESGLVLVGETAA